MSLSDGTYEEQGRELELARKRIAELEAELSRRGNGRDCSGVEEALHQSEAKYRLLAEKMNDIVWTADRDFNLTYMSPSVEKIMGYTLEERRGQPSTLTMTPESAARTMEIFLSELQRDREPGVDPDRSVLVEVEMIHKNGSRVWLEVSSSFIRDGAGNIIGTHGVSRDITERKRSEEALQLSEAKHRMLAEKMNDMVWTADKEFNFTYMSPSVEKILGYTPQERLGRNSSSLMTTESAAKVFNIFITELQRDRDPGVDPDRSVLAEVEMFHKNGSRVWLEVNSSLVRDAAGNVIGTHGVSRDITERKRSEEALRQSEARYRLLTEKMNDIVWVTDMEFNLTYMSPSVEKIMGYTPQERVGKKASSTMTPESAAKAFHKFVEEIERVRESGRDTVDPIRMELEYLHKNGSTVWMEVNASLLLDAAGNIMGAQGVSRDITERMRMREELKRQNERLECLVRERTAELTETYEHLKEENESRKATEAALRSREEELEQGRRELVELNAALKVLLRQREEDRRTNEMNLVSNMRQSVMPFLAKLEDTELNDNQRTFIAIVKSNLQEITSPFIRQVSSGYMGFTPSEIQVATLIKEGRTSKEIARIMNISLNTVHTYRNMIRKKTNTKNSKVNLRAYLLSLG